MFREVPVLPLVVPLAAAVFLALLWHLRRRGMLSAPRAAVAFALCFYVAGVVANTVFPIYLDMPSRSGSPWHSSLYLEPFENYEAADAVMNIVVFVPVGMIVPLLLARTSLWRVVAVAAALSLTIEATQLLTARLLGGGHVADVNDLMFNVLGGLLGCVLFEALSRVPGLGVALDRFRWR